jgi:predicted metalloendopeptidase
MILPDALCNLYADAQHDQVKLDDIEDLVDKLRGAAASVMDETHILSKKSRAGTKEKIHRMQFEIGKGPPAPLPNVTYNPNSLLHSFILVLQARSKEISYLAGRPSERKKSSYACFVSNASYFSESNNIVMPWGILQWPFYCKNAPLGWNYGGIGATISHEMTHAFDLEGVEYNPRAIYREWWTRKDKNRFGQKTRKVCKFFNQFKHYGIPLNGKKTLSENWADLGGIFISLRGLKTLLDSRGASDDERKEAHRQFFISYAISWRTLVRKEKMLYAITTSVHAPAIDRVDRIVPQFQEWYDAFDIKETDPLYVKPKDRLKFF